MQNFDLIIESESSLEDILKAELPHDEIQFSSTEQRNMDGTLPTYILIAVTTLDIILKVLDIFLKSSEARDKLKSVSVNETKLGDITINELKKLIDYYKKKKK